MPSDDANTWAKTQTIASLLALIAIILAIVALINERIQRARSRDVGSVAADTSKMGYFYVPRLSHWSAFYGKKTQVLKVISIRGLVKAGDSQIWTSTVLDELPATTSEIDWVALYGNIFNETARRLTSEHRDAFPRVIRTFIGRADEGIEKKQVHLKETKDRLVDEESKIHREEILGKDSVKLRKMRKKLEKHQKSYKVDRQGYYEPSSLDLINCCRGLDTTDQTGPIEPDDDELGLQDVQNTWLVRNTPCIATSREELAALALILGMTLKWHTSAPSLGGVGAFGTSLRAAQENGTWRLHFMHAGRIPRHAPSPGSGYTTVMAKHIACGSLPFADASKWVRSIFVTDKVLRGVRAGGSVKDVQSFGGHALEYLRRLPAAKQIDAYYDIDSNPRPDESLGLILRSDGSPFPNGCTWSRAVTGIAFGGLVPQAAEHLAQAVSFTVAGIQGQCFEELEALINMLHRHSFAKGLFGDFVTERIGAEDSIDNVNYTLPARNSDVRDAAAVFARYMTLLERITARCEVVKNGVDAVFEAACKLIQRTSPRSDKMKARGP